MLISDQTKDYKSYTISVPYNSDPIQTNEYTRYTQGIEYKMP